MPGLGPQTFSNSRDGTKVFRVELLEKDIEQFDEWERSLVRYMRVEDQIGIQATNFLMVPATEDPREKEDMDEDDVESFNKKLVLGVANLEKFMSTELQKLMEDSEDWQNLYNHPENIEAGAGFHTILSAIKRDAVDRGVPQQLMRKWDNLRQGPGALRDFDKFARKVKSLAASLNRLGCILTRFQIKEKIKAGMMRKDLRVFLDAPELDNLEVDEFISRAVRLGAAVIKTNNPPRPGQPNSPGEAANASTTTDVMASETIEDKKKKKQCHHCKSDTHLIKDCPIKKKQDRKRKKQHGDKDGKKQKESE